MDMQEKPSHTAYLVQKVTQSRRECKTEKCKTLEEKWGKNHRIIGLVKYYLETTPKEQFIKGQLDKLDFLEQSSFVFLPPPPEKKTLLREITGWEKLFAKYVSGKRLVSWI